MPDRKRLLILTGIAAALGIAVHAATRPDPDPAPTPVALAVTPPAPAAPIVLPPPPPPPPPPPAPTIAQRGSIPGLSINATFATRAGGGSILVTRADGSRATIATGSDAAPGIRLTGVAADRATFTTGSTVFWVPLRSESAAKADPGPAVVASAAPPPPPPASGPTATELRESQGYQAALAPSLDGAYRGYTVRGAMPLFARAGLKPGDIITGINGRAFDSPAEIAKLSREAAMSATVTFQIRRDGKTQELQVQPR